MGGTGLGFLFSLFCLKFSLRNPKEVPQGGKHIGEDWNCVLLDPKMACGSATKSQKNPQAVQAVRDFALPPTHPLEWGFGTGHLKPQFIFVSSWLPLDKADVELHCFPLMFICRPPQPWLVNSKLKLLHRKLQSK